MWSAFSGCVALSAFRNVPAKQSILLITHACLQKTQLFIPELLSLGIYFDTISKIVMGCYKPTEFLFPGSRAAHAAHHHACTMAHMYVHTFCGTGHGPSEMKLWSHVLGEQGAAEQHCGWILLFSSLAETAMPV